jgi:hypothetical protein
MKSSSLKRKKPLKRSKIPLKKSKLSPVSKKRNEWLGRYRISIKRDSALGWIAMADCGYWTQKIGLERHHPFGRSGKYIMIYCYINHSTHAKIHAESRWAREVGWLQGPYEGRPIDPNAPRPWDKYPGSLINENLLTSDEFKIKPLT